VIRNNTPVTLRRGCGDDLQRHRGIGGALLCTVFKERSTRHVVNMGERKG
jgi:hypothetical protein